jgi:hypothetical protein
MKDFDFQDELLKFQQSVIEEWLNVKKQHIGVSIQLYNEVQNKKYSETRIDPVNSFCIKTVSDKKLLSKCDLLDIELKEEVSRKRNNSGIACRCHKGVSNIITPFKHKGEKDVWYILYGQFILTYSNDSNTMNNEVDTFAHKRLAEKKFREHGIEIKRSQTLSKRSSYVLDEPFVVKAAVKDFKESDIHEVDFIDFLMFKSNVETKFALFLDKILLEQKSAYEKYKGESNPILKLLVKSNEIYNTLQKRLKSHKSVDKTTTEKALNLVETLKNNLETHQKSKLSDSTIQLINDILIDETDHKFDTETWIKSLEDANKKIKFDAK